MMNAQLAEKEVNGRGGLVVKRVSLWGAFILCRVRFYSPPKASGFHAGLDLSSGWWG